MVSVLLIVKGLDYRSRHDWAVLNLTVLQFKMFKRKLWAGLGKDEDAEDRPRVVVVLVESLVFVIFFSSIFLLIPAAIFTALENENGDWEYMDSVYYTFITLSTIGFGDMVPGNLFSELLFLLRFISLPLFKSFFVDLK